ncbi:hypothetical protein M1558_01885 [Candidatus Parvarchaeota archaeon]|nr:hypothetical protein [Candidatus Parvarchaeota archaeon]
MKTKPQLRFLIKPCIAGLNQKKKDGKPTEMNSGILKKLKAEFKNMQ